MFTLCVSASDSSGGAGMQRDVTVCDRHGVRPLCALTGVTVQTHDGLLRAEAVSDDLLREQLAACVDNYAIAAVKVGAICGERQVRVIADALRKLRAPIVLDPVFTPTSGGAFLHDVAVWRELLMALATVITPNRHELARLADMPVDSPEQALAAAKTLGTACFVTGGHFTGEEIVEWLVRGEEAQEFRKPRTPLRETHGTGCALSTAIACRLVQGDSLTDACRIGSLFVDEVMG